MKRSVWLLAVFCGFLALPCLAQNAAAIVFATGGAQILGSDGKARPVTRGAEVSPGETVETTDGRVQMRFRDGASVSLQTQTSFRIDEFRFAEQNGKASAEDKGFFSLLKGGFRTISGLIGKDRHEQYKVDTVVATIGIRGTDYAAGLSEQGLTVNTFGGLVEVCNAAGCVLVAPGESVVVPDPNSPPRKVGGGASALPGVPALPSLPSPRPVDAPDVPVSPQQNAPYSPPITHGPYR